MNNFVNACLILLNRVRKKGMLIIKLLMINLNEVVVQFLMKILKIGLRKEVDLMILIKMIVYFKMMIYMLKEVILWVKKKMIINDLNKVVVRLMMINKLIVNSMNLSNIECDAFDKRLNLNCKKFNQFISKFYQVILKIKLELRKRNHNFKINFN